MKIATFCLKFYYLQWTKYDFFTIYINLRFYVELETSNNNKSQYDMKLAPSIYRISKLTVKTMHSVGVTQCMRICFRLYRLRFVDIYNNLHRNQSGFGLLNFFPLTHCAFNLIKKNVKFAKRIGRSCECSQMRCYCRWTKRWYWQWQWLVQFKFSLMHYCCRFNLLPIRLDARKTPNFRLSCVHIFRALLICTH